MKRLFAALVALAALVAAPLFLSAPAQALSTNPEYRAMTATAVKGNKVEAPVVKAAPAPVKAGKTSKHGKSSHKAKSEAPAAAAPAHKSSSHHGKKHHTKPAVKVDAPVPATEKESGK